METWPASLPQNVLSDGYSEKPPNTLIRTKMDAGPDKVRRRHTAGVRPFTENVLMSTAQVATLDTFYVTTTNGGADQWTWKNQRTDTTANFRFVSEPIYTHRSGNYYNVQLNLEQLP